MTTSTKPSLFADEEVPSNYGYPEGFKPKLIPDQIDPLCNSFVHQLGCIEFGSIVRLADQKLPSGAEANYLIARWEAIAISYDEALEWLFAALAEQWPFRNYLKGQLHCLSPIARTKEMIAKLEASQTNRETVVLPAQFGFHQRGRSIRRVRYLTEQTEREFGLGAFAVGCMILTHPERFKCWGQLQVDCPGDEGISGDFIGAPSFSFLDGNLEFHLNPIDRAYDRNASVTGFLPE